MREIKSIETKYKGFNFRSRIEARWCVFFEQAEIKYQYEPEGFHTKAGRYLPDFYLPEFDCYFEVKGDMNPSEEEINKCIALSNQLEKPIFLAMGSFKITEDLGLYSQKDMNMVLILGECNDNWRTEKDYINSLLWFYDNNLYNGDLHDYLTRTYPNFNLPMGKGKEFVKKLIKEAQDDCIYKTGKEHKKYKYGRSIQNLLFETNTDSPDGWGISVTHGSMYDETIVHAYRMAQMARFEHGQRG